jgi:hypothetical protein
VKLAGDGLQVLGGAFVPAVQLSVTELVYPFTADIVPLKADVCPAKVVSGVFEAENQKSGVITRLNCHMPRPYVEARSNCCPP